MFLYLEQSLWLVSKTPQVREHFFHLRFKTKVKVTMVNRSFPDFLKKEVRVLVQRIGTDVDISAEVNRWSCLNFSSSDWRLVQCWNAQSTVSHSIIWLVSVCNKLRVQKISWKVLSLSLTHRIVNCYWAKWFDLCIWCANLIYLDWI